MRWDYPIIVIVCRAKQRKLIQFRKRIMIKKEREEKIN